MHRGNTARAVEWRCAGIAEIINISNIYGHFMIRFDSRMPLKLQGTSDACGRFASVSGL
jgi:hypothetical protein